MFNWGVVIALIVGAVTAGVSDASAAPPGISAVTCNEGKWETRSYEPWLVRFLPNHNPAGSECFLDDGDYDNWGVVALQNMLVRCYNQMIAIDGDFGPLTDQALRNAQRWAREVEKRDVAVNGVYSAQVRDELRWPHYPVKDIYASFLCFR